MATDAERFLQETEANANRRHPYILSLSDSGTVDGPDFDVMPFVERESLWERISREG